MEIKTLWGEEFKVATTNVEKLLLKIENPDELDSCKDKKILEKLPLSYRLEVIRKNVYRILGKYADQTVVITTRDQLTSYIDAAIANGEIAIDTETNNSLDPITCKLMGPCIYTPGQKNAYIPLNHINPDTGERLEHQLGECDIAEEFSRLVNTKIIMHNGPFDYKVIKCTTGCQLKVYWDTLVAARILNENEMSAGLKQQYIDKIDPSIEKYSINHLFEGLLYEVIPPDLFALYAATDAYMTYMLYKWQEERFQSDPSLAKLLNLFLTVEMPIVEVVAEMELAGVTIDGEYAKRLSAKYHRMLEEVDFKIYNLLEDYDRLIRLWRNTPEANERPTNPKTGKVGKSKSEKLKTPVCTTSNTQLAILLYDILKAPIVDEENPRGTGEDILLKLKDDFPLCDLLLEKRHLEKLLGTFIDKLPSYVNIDGRLHAHFNQVGTDTGRFSSSEPNLQQIPSSNKEIRMMFRAAQGCVLIGSDFSQQEPRLLSNYSQDDNMINAYKNGKDLYATVATGVYKNSYWDNMEFTDETKTVKNPDGEKRRSNCKSLLLGIMYGRGVASIAEQIGGTTQEAQKIIDDFYSSYPKVKQWIDSTQASAHEKGYVEDLWGRRRRLPDIQLPKYEAEFIHPEKVAPFNPLIGSNERKALENHPKLLNYLSECQACRGRKDFDVLRDKAKQEGINLTDNGWKISQAERQCVNARIQGGAATMSKKAMINVYKDSRLRELGFKLLIAIHDELIGECPEEFAEEAAARLSEIMRKAALPECVVPFKCDAEISKSWYEPNYYAMITKEYNKNLSKGCSPEEALKELLLAHTEVTKEELLSHLKI